MNTKLILHTIGIGAAASVALPVFGQSAGYERVLNSKPNIIFILADDLGYGDLGCYGQKKIKTPNIDRLAKEGVRFTQHYSGSPVCAPSRCCLLTGLHTGHAYIRDNEEIGEWYDFSGQLPLPDGTTTIAELFKEHDYSTGVIGKWGLGGPESEGIPNKQGFDYFYGYLCQRAAHNYYPEYLWENEEKDSLENESFKPHQIFPEGNNPSDPKEYERYKGKEYSQDKMIEKAINFIKDNRGNKFFLFLPVTIPHVALQVPDESVEMYKDKFDDKPYLGENGYLPHQYPRAAYAAMITRLDEYVGEIMNLLSELGIDENTLVIFTSDNGPSYAGGADYEFFNSAGGLNGLKGSVYEGGIRVPLIARWPGKILPSTTSSHVSAFWDFMPTFAELIGSAVPVDIDGISILPSLVGDLEKQKNHEYLYWEYARSTQAVRMDDWKAVKLNQQSDIALYNLRNDPYEKTNVSSRHPEIVKKIEEVMTKGRTDSYLFPLIKE